MKNILIITRTLSYGGAERTAVNLANQLSGNKDYFVTLCALDGTEGTYDVDKGVNFIDLNLRIFNRGNKFVFYKNLLSGIIRIKRRYRINVSISFLNEPDLANVLTKRKNEKVIISIRNKQSKMSISRFKRIKDKFILKRADMIVSLSQMVKSDLISVFGVQSSKISVVYNFGNTELIEKLSQTEISSKEEKIFDSSKVVINVGRLENQKGQWHLIKAFKKVRDTIPEAKLIILGKGSLLGDIEHLIEILSLDKDVFLLGFKKNPYPYIRKASLFAFSSLFEGLGNVLIETLSCDTPIISTDCDAGPREILAPETNVKLTGTAQEIVYGNYGILVPMMIESELNFNKELDYSENLLAEAIIEFLMSKDMEIKYKEKVKRRAEAYENSKILKDWVSVIERIS